MGTGSETERALGLGEELLEVHDWLRDELDRVRGGGVASTDLRAHCLAFCGALTAHHTSEDRVAFAELRRAAPSLGPLLDELTRDHEVVAAVLRRVTDVADGLGATTEPAERDRLVGELDGLRAVMESHFAWEERRLLAALDGLRSTCAPADLYGVVPGGPPQPLL